MKIRWVDYRGASLSQPEPNAVSAALRAVFPLWSRVALGALALASAALWFSPLSPDALGQADARLWRGDASGAVAKYDAIARRSGDSDQAAAALVRSARVQALELGELDAARDSLASLASRVHDPEQLAASYAEIGELYLQDGRPAEAAESFLAAVAAFGLSADAALWRIRAAYAQLDAGDADAAERTWRSVVARHPAYRARAYLALARLHLERDEADEALKLFERALEAAPDGAEHAVARLGVGTCLARLGNLDQALAHIDAAELPDHVRAARTDAIRSRLSGSL